MPVIKSAAKALRQAKKRTLQNKGKVSSLKTEVKKFKKEKNSESLAKIYSLVDKMTKTHVIHKNKSKRLKSRFALMITPKPSPKKKTS